jgi:hypothetical protein
MQDLYKEEKRRFLRIPCENFITYTVMNEDGTENPGSSSYVHCKNISLVGVLFTAFEPIAPGTTLKMQLQLDITRMGRENIMMYGTVNRCERLKNTDTWDVAANITSMIEAEKRLLFLNWLSSKDEDYHMF